ncbi:MAG: energy-coupling factor transporter transmembrane protein EcfT, partial [Calditrichaeota bacterium]
AQLSRGASLEGSLLERVKNIIPMIVPLFVSAIRRADDLALAMEARNYVADATGRTSFRSLRFSVCDVQMLLFTVAVMGTVVVLH